MEPVEIAEIAVRAPGESELPQVIETMLMNACASRGLPSEGIFALPQERLDVLRNVDSVVGLLDAERKASAFYFSKFLAAVASGLFDAALNYLWDETVVELRRRVAMYDLQYFYDNAVSNSDRRSEYFREEDLVNLSDEELINGTYKIEMISRIGHEQLKHIKFMRNWASAAHPNSAEISGLNLISWMQTCIKEVILLPLNDIAVQIGELLRNIKSYPVPDAQVAVTGQLFSRLSSKQASNLAMGFYGIFSQPDSPQVAKDNILKLFPILLPVVSDVDRYAIGMKHARLVMHNDAERLHFSSQLVEHLGLKPYLPQEIRETEADSALDVLWDAHVSYNNFYTEPGFARELERTIGGKYQFSEGFSRKFVVTLVSLFMGNRYGVSRSADPVYERLLSGLTQEMAVIAVFSYLDEKVYSKFGRGVANEKFMSVLDICGPKISNPAVQEVVLHMSRFASNPVNMLRDSVLATRTEQLRVMKLLP